MAIDLEDTFRKGGKGLLDLVQFGVYSVQLEPVFVWLVQEYRVRATIPGVLALTDIFCTTGSPARVRVQAVLPPYDLRLERTVKPLREAMVRVQAAPPDVENPPVLPLPSRQLFDFIVAHLLEQQDGPLQRIAASYDPTLSPHENLPGGRLNQGQRFFVEKVWQPQLRPRLVAAGFGRVASIGG